MLKGFLKIQFSLNCGLFLVICKWLIKDEKKKFEILNLTQSLDTHHYNQRSMVERVNKYLKDDFGCNTIYYQGATKVASVLAFGILSICIHQSLKLVTWDF